MLTRFSMLALVLAVLASSGCVYHDHDRDRDRGGRHDHDHRHKKDRDSYDRRDDDRRGDYYRRG